MLYLQKTMLTEDSQVIKSSKEKNVANTGRAKSSDDIVKCFEQQRLRKRMTFVLWLV